MSTEASEFGAVAALASSWGLLQRRDDRWQLLADVAFELDGNRPCTPAHFHRALRMARLLFAEPEAAALDFEGYALNAFIRSLQQAADAISSDGHDPDSKSQVRP